MEIIIVDDANNEIGYAEKLYVHKKGLLHRAFSVILFNDKNEILIQQRALDKYHCGGLWANSCCSHPLKGEDSLSAVHRRVKEELRCNCDVDYLFTFQYKAEFNNGLTENEIDSVFIGVVKGELNINKEEVEMIKWMNFEEILIDIHNNPDIYAPWFKIIMTDYTEKIKNYITKSSKYPMI